MPIDISSELEFRTARSSGKGGQHVNKVETRVTACFNLEHSVLLTTEQKDLLRNKLGKRISREGMLSVRSQTDRSQLGNKLIAIGRINELVNQALIIPEKRVKSKPSRASGEKRLREKKANAEKKLNRRQIF